MNEIKKNIYTKVVKIKNVLIIFLTQVNQKSPVVIRNIL